MHRFSAACASYANSHVTPGLMRHQELIQILSGGVARLRLHRLVDVPPNSGNFRSSLEAVSRAGETRFILDCNLYSVSDILHQVFNY